MSLYIKNNPLVIICGVLVTPVYLLSLLVVICLRQIVHIYLLLTKTNYVSLLDIHDLFFDTRLDDEPLNYLCVVGDANLTTLGSSEELRQEIIAVGKKNFSRMNVKISEWCGFRYWERIPVNYEKQVRFFECKNREEIKSFLSDIAQTQPSNDAIWEVYVSKYPIEGNVYPIVCRVHHSGGDGFTLRDELLSQTLPKPFAKIEKILSTAFTYAPYVLMGPTYTIGQYLRPKEENSLKSQKLTLKKQIGWGEIDFEALKEIKRHTGRQITVIALSALSFALERLFKSRNESIPYITLALPYRPDGAKEFVPIGLRIPVESTDRENEIAAQYERFKNKPFYQIDFFLPKQLTALFPTATPKWVNKCTDYTSVFSNFPGPANKEVMNGFEFVSSLYLNPNMTENCLGMSMSFFNGRCNVGIMMDSIVAKTSNDADTLVEGVIEYIEKCVASLKKQK